MAGGPGGVSNLLLVLFNFVTALLGGAIAGLGAWLATKDSQMCLQFLHKPILCFGVFIAAVSAMALLAAFFRIGILLRIYLLLLMLLILACVAFAIFSFVVTHTTAAKALANVSYKQYRIGDYSTWLQQQINNTANWARIRACLSDSKMCFYSYTNSTAFLSTIVTFIAQDAYVRTTLLYYSTTLLLLTLLLPYPTLTTFYFHFLQHNTHIHYTFTHTFM